MFWISVVLTCSFFFLFSGILFIIGGADKSVKLFKNKIHMFQKKKKRFKTNTNKKSKLSNPVYLGVLSSIAFFIITYNIGIALIMGVLGYLYPSLSEKEKSRKRMNVLNIQFRDAMQSVSNSLRAGKSLENSLETCLEDMNRLYKYQTEKPIVEEWELIVKDLRIGRGITEVLVDFRDKVKLEDVDTFVNSAIIVNEKGGNLTEVMSNVAEMISDRIEIKRDIMTMTAGKRMEAKMLTFMPIILVGMIAFLSPSYLAPMYESFWGKVLLCIATVMLIGNYFIGKQIIDIEV